MGSRFSWSGIICPKDWGVRNLLYVIDVLIKYAVVKPWRSIKAKTVIDGFA